MANSPTITKVSVTQKQNKLFTITLNLKYADGEVIAFSENFSQEYRTGDSISDLAAAFREDMEAAIAEYNTEQAYLSHAQMDNMVTWLNNNVS